LISDCFNIFLVLQNMENMLSIKETMPLFAP